MKKRQVFAADRDQTVEVTDPGKDDSGRFDGITLNVIELGDDEELTVIKMILNLKPAAQKRVLSYSYRRNCEVDRGE